VALVPGLILDAATSRRLGKIRQRDTTAEQRVRRALWALGLRYRVGVRGLPGSPDLANRSARWAVFVHGCYWHSHRGCPRATVPKRNRSFWLDKFAANRARDARVRRALRRLGFLVFVVWECQALDERRLEGAARRIATQVASTRKGGHRKVRTL
jgi:DNA mismatch endonuclease (patch repair protein)